MNQQQRGEQLFYMVYEESRKKRNKKKRGREQIENGEQEEGVQRERRQKKGKIFWGSMCRKKYQWWTISKSPESRSAFLKLIQSVLCLDEVKRCDGDVTPGRQCFGLLRSSSLGDEPHTYNIFFTVAIATSHSCGGEPVVYVCVLTPDGPPLPSAWVFFLGVQSFL